jgi:hypothetical protein
MAFNPNIYYPTGYQPFQNNYQSNQQMFSGQMTAPVQQTAQNSQGLIWVQGEVGAKSYLMTPNSTVMLMDSEGDRFYIKSTDGAGMPTIQTYEYKACTNDQFKTAQNDSKSLSEQFVTRDEYDSLLGKYDALIEKIEELKKDRSSSRKKEVETNE